MTKRRNRSSSPPPPVKGGPSKPPFKLRFTPDAAAVFDILSGENGWQAVVNRLAKVVTDLAQGD